MNVPGGREREYDPSLDGVRFVVFGDWQTATVHVFRDFVTLEVGDEPGDSHWRTLSSTDHPVLGLMALDRAWCGTRSRAAGVWGIGAFADERLCQRCVKAWPWDSVLLFEHELP